ncbi:MAG: hypothetical protein HY978_03805 [Candidatus Liptonbacteria bacterium]|nr:hypothetical protein [Candidatus Liptonbacteria bacterium]
MIISLANDGSLRLQSGEAVLLADPTNNRQKADVILRTVTDPAAVAMTDGEVTLPGEYEVRGIEVRGWQLPDSTSKQLHTAYLVYWEDLRFLFLGQLLNSPEKALGDLGGEIDLVFFGAPRGHFPPDPAAKLLRQLEAAAILPVGYAATAELARALGRTAESVEKFVFKKKDLVAKQGRVILLTGERN